MKEVLDPNTWLTEHGDYLFRYASFRINDTSLAEDLVQETFLAGLRNRQQFSGRSSERTWLLGILKHKILDHYRHQKREHIGTGDQDVETLADTLFNEKGHWKVEIHRWADPNASLEQKRFWQILQRCISALPATQADVFIMKEINGLSSEELCKELNISTTNNLWVMLSRARTRLRACLEEAWFRN